MRTHSYACMCFVYAQMSCACSCVFVFVFVFVCVCVRMPMPMHVRVCGRVRVRDARACFCVVRLFSRTEVHLISFSSSLFYNYQGQVYLQYVDVASATKAILAFNRRWFGGQMITAEFLPPAMFPQRK